MTDRNSIIPMMTALLLFALVGFAGCSDDPATPDSGDSGDDNTLVLSGEYTIVDTGQEKCFDDQGMEISSPAEGEAFCGQDAQFESTQFSFTTTGTARSPTAIPA